MVTLTWNVKLRDAKTNRLTRLNSLIDFAWVNIDLKSKNEEKYSTISEGRETIYDVATVIEEIYKNATLKCLMNQTLLVTRFLTLKETQNSQHWLRFLIVNFELLVQIKHYKKKKRKWHIGDAFRQKWVVMMNLPLRSLILMYKQIPRSPSTVQYFSSTTWYNVSVSNYFYFDTQSQISIFFWKKKRK